MRNMLAIWREHGIDDAMRTAWERGVVLAGLSAGAMCWFEGGVSMSGGQPEVVHGIGLLPGSLSVHLDGESERLPVYERGGRHGRAAAGFAADDGAAVVYHGTRLAECVARAATPEWCVSRPTVAAGRSRRPSQCGCSRTPSRRVRRRADARALRRLRDAGAAGRAASLGLRTAQAFADRLRRARP